MYLVKADEKLVLPFWVYNHDQFKKRPTDKQMKAQLATLMKATR